MTGLHKILSRKSSIIIALSVIILNYSFFVGEYMMGLIVIFFLVIVSKLIPSGTNPLNSPLLWLLSIIVISYFFFIGEYLLGLLTLFLIYIIWLLIYKTINTGYKKDLDRPLGIAMLSALYAISAFFFLVRSIMGIPVVVIGKSISGFPSQLIYTFMILLNIYLAYGFNKLLKPAWVISIIYTLYGLMNTIIYFSYSQWSYFIIYPLFLNMVILAYIIGKSEYFLNK